MAECRYNSIHKQLFTLPDDTIVYPAHDYKGRTASTIGTTRPWALEDLDAVFTESIALEH